jgi:D-serine deaminase-like pyridoxal phosphate-dependent protein
MANPYHDPETGEFTNSPGGSSRVAAAIKKAVVDHGANVAISAGIGAAFGGPLGAVRGGSMYVAAQVVSKYTSPEFATLAAFGADMALDRMIARRSSGIANSIFKQHKRGD